MAEAFQAGLVSGSGDTTSALVRLGRDEVFISDSDGHEVVRIPVAAITRFEIDVSPEVKIRRAGPPRFRGGYTAEIGQSSGPPVRIRALGGGDVRSAFDAMHGSDGAQTRLMTPIHGYRQFVVELAVLLRARGVPVTVGKRGLVEGWMTAVAIGLAGAGLLGWLVTQPYRSLYIGLYVVGPIMILGAANMIRRTPAARPREVDGGEASLDAYLPKVT